MDKDNIFHTFVAFIVAAKREGLDLDKVQTEVKHLIHADDIHSTDIENKEIKIRSLEKAIAEANKH